MTEYQPQAEVQANSTGIPFVSQIHKAEPASASAVALPIPSAATVSLVFGILGLCFTPPFLSAIIAIVAGYIARRNIRRNNGQFGGLRQATMGMIMGAISLGLSLFASFIWLVWIVINHYR